MEDADDKELLRRVAGQGPAAREALGALFKRYRKPLLAFLIRHGAAREQAEDVVQDVFLRLGTSAPGFRGDAAVSSWLHQMVRNRLVDVFRRAGREPTLDDDAWATLQNTLPAGDNTAGVDPAQQADRSALQRCVEAAYERFARQHPAMADALHHVVTLEWTARDLALAHNRSHDAMRQFLVTCRRHLGAALQPCQDLAKAVLHG